MGDVSIIGLDIAKNSFQAHGSGCIWRGSLFARSFSAEDGVLSFFAAQPPSTGWRWRRVAGRIIGGASWPGSGTRCG